MSRVLTAASTLPQDPENPYAAQGPVLVDIGGDRGAVIVIMPATLRGRELAYARGIEGSAHVMVLDRPLPSGGALTCAVISGVPSGRYRLWLLEEHAHGPHASHGPSHEHAHSHSHLPDGGEVSEVLEVSVVAGEVVSVTWPSAVGPA